VALTAEQIKSLPENYASALASRAFAEKHDPDHSERPFLPPDLLKKDGSWVEVVADNGSTVTASRHVFDFGARSVFRVFLRFPEGRKATVDYLARLGDFPQPWLPSAEPDRKRELLRLNPDLPQFPVGTQVALVRQMLLIDKEGALIPSPLTESVQLRVFRKVAGAHPDDRRPGDPDPQDSYEFTLKRVLLFAGKNGGLQPVERDEKDFRSQLLVIGYDEFDSQDNDSLETQMGRPIRSCLGCHDRPGIYSFRSYIGGDYPRGQYYLPRLRENYGEGNEQARLTTFKKQEQYSWGLLRGLWEDVPSR
jgi:hypothetical protein